MDLKPKLDLIILDCPDALALGRFYADVLGWGMEDGADERWCTLIPPGGGISPDNPDGRATLAFQRIDDWVEPTWPGGAHPQQFHLDLATPDMEALRSGCPRRGRPHARPPTVEGRRLPGLPRPRRAPVLPDPRLSLAQRTRKVTQVDLRPRAERMASPETVMVDFEPTRRSVRTRPPQSPLPSREGTTMRCRLPRPGQADSKRASVTFSDHAWWGLPDQPSYGSAWAVR